jgi:hypothetical protein
MSRVLDRSRPFSSIYGGGARAFRQDGIDFDVQGREFLPPRLATGDSERGAASSTVDGPGTQAGSEGQGLALPPKPRRPGKPDINRADKDLIDQVAKQLGLP